MQSKKIGIKFCGHCSPRKDMQKLSERLIETAEGFTFVHYFEDPYVDVLLILNACESACASCPFFVGPVIIVTPTTVDRQTVQADEMAAAIKDALLEG